MAVKDVAALSANLFEDMGSELQPAEPAQVVEKAEAAAALRENDAS